MPDIKTGQISVTGFAELEKSMLQFTDRVAKNVLNGMVRAGAVVIQKEARLKAPVGSKPHLLVSRRSKGDRAKGVTRMGTWLMPGNLKKNIKVRKAPRGTGKESSIYWVYVSSKTAWYWRFVEFGTSKQSSRPFMRSAFEAKKMEAIDKMSDYGGKRIEKEAAKR